MNYQPTWRRALLVGLAVAGIARPARAVDVVTAPILETMTQWGISSTVVSWGQQAASMAKEIATLNAQLQQVQMLYNMLNNPVALIGYASNLLTGDSQSPLGDSIAATVSLASGVGRLSNTASGFAASVQNTNAFYLPPLNGNFINQVMVARSNQTSAIQAQIEMIMRSQQDRMMGLQQLQMAINQGGDSNRMGAYAARMQSEIAIGQQQQQQLNGLIGLAQIQAQVEQQQMAQKASLDSNQFLADRSAASGGLVNFNSPSPGAVVSASAVQVPNFPVAP